MAARHRTARTIGASLVALFILAACGTVSTGSAAPTNSVTPTARATPTGTTPAPTTRPPNPAGYPAAARGYAEAVLAAWTLQQTGRLADLTTPPALQQLGQVTGEVDPNWIFQQCDGAAGSSYCAFANGDGDVVTVRVLNQYVGQAHAASEVKLDRTVYPADAKEYVKSFVEAWRNGNVKRMLALSGQSEVDYFRHYTPPDTYTVCGVLVGSVWQVRVYNPYGLNYLVKVAGSALGGRHAIAGHVDPATAIC